MPKTSIYTISKELGVSPATVSRALNMHPSISAEVRERVRKAAERRKFKPRFVSSRPMAVYALIQQVKGHPLDFDNFLARSLEGIAEYCRDEGIEMGVYSSDVESLNECDIVRELRKRGANAAVVLRASKDSKYLEQMESQKFPHFQLFNGFKRSSPYLFEIDNASLAKKMAGHLAELGHRKMGFIIDTAQFPSHLERLESFKAALAEKGLPCGKELFFSGDELPQIPLGGGLEVGAIGVKALLERNEGLSAVCAVGDSVAKGALGWLHRNGVAVPGKLSVASFDDFPETAYLCPPLTTMRIPYQKIAYEGARQAHRLSKGLEVQMPSGLGGELVIRESTGPAAAKPRRGK